MKDFAMHLTWLSRPMKNSIKKNRAAQTGDTGKVLTAEGYTRNAKPGPEKKYSKRIGIKSIHSCISFFFIKKLTLDKRESILTLIHPPGLKTIRLTSK